MISLTPAAGHCRMAVFSVLLPAVAGLALATGIEAQEGPAVEGRVVAGGTLAPVPGAWVQLVTVDGERRLVSGVVDEEGRYSFTFHRLVAEDAGAVVIEAGALGYRSGRSEPFELDPEGTVSVPTLELALAPIELDTLRIEEDRRFRFQIPPREVVLERQLRGRGTFLPGAAISNLPESRFEWALANQLDELRIHPLRGLRAEPTPSNPDGCMLFMINQWPVSSQAFLRLGRREIGAMEVYVEFEDIPEELRSEVLQEAGHTRCGLVNAWTWGEWNRGIEPDG